MNTKEKSEDNPPISIYVPRALRTYCDDNFELALEAANVRDILYELERQHPALYGCICDETGAVRRHINLFVNTAHVRDLQGLDTPLKRGDEFIVLPAVSGG